MRVTFSKCMQLSGCRMHSATYIVSTMRVASLCNSMEYVSPFRSIEVPARVLALHPEWKFCTAYYGGFHDPPKTLEAGTFLVPTAVQDQPTNVPAMTPTPGMGPPNPPQPTSSVQSNPMITVDMPVTRTRYTPIVVPRPTVPMVSVLELAPIKVTVRPATAFSQDDEIITLLPTWVPTLPNDADVSEQQRELASFDPSQLESVLVSLVDVLAAPKHAEGIVVVVVGSQTLLPGEAITIGGTIQTHPISAPVLTHVMSISLDINGTEIVINGDTVLPLTPVSTPGTQPLLLKLDGTTYVADAAGRFTVADQILKPGGIITIHRVPKTLSDGHIDDSRRTVSRLT